jgi:hypothetical protein
LSSFDILPGSFSSLTYSGFPVDVSGVVKIHAHTTSHGKPGQGETARARSLRGPAGSTHCDTLELRNELVAQSVEQRTFNAWVVGSIPTELTTFRSYRTAGWRAITARHAPYQLTFMATTPLCAAPLNSLQVTALHDRCTAAWGLTTSDAFGKRPKSWGSFGRISSRCPR